MTQAPVLRRDLPPEIPDDVDDVSVDKARGVGTLPWWIDWSSDDPTYDLADRWQRILIYEQVLREGTAEDVRASQARWLVALSALQERVATLVAALPESADLVLAGGAAMAAHDMLDRALESVPTRYGPALDVRELGAVLAIFGRAEPRDFVDLAELARRVPFDELVALAKEKDPGLDSAVLNQCMERVQVMRPESLGLAAASYRALVEQVQHWRAHVRDLLARQSGGERPDPWHGLGL